ncbi:MAG: hemolysin III family protein [Acholeplasmataceae bacterium]|jgi:hemolysin III|nr:hemolysin III family protein [Acidaminococcaceae bacterium]NLY84082.1 hemolysin III family protein [Acholeplasmataceae bacterium]
MEERLNAVTHGIGTVVAAIGLYLLVALAFRYGSLWHVVSFSIYGTTLVLMYLTSTLYHSFRNERLKYLFKILDHSAIYLLIAGTYTPFALIILHGWLGWTLLGIVWGLAILGVVLTIFYVQRFRKLSTLCYILMGWLIILCVKPMLERLDVAGIVWLIAGGLFYSFGAIFYLMKRFPYNHAIWHLFVLAGSVSQFIAVVYYVLPVPV